MNWYEWHYGRFDSLSKSGDLGDTAYQNGVLSVLNVLCGPSRLVSFISVPGTIGGVQGFFAMVRWKCAIPGCGQRTPDDGEVCMRCGKPRPDLEPSLAGKRPAGSEEDGPERKKKKKNEADENADEEKTMTPSRTPIADKVIAEAEEEEREENNIGGSSIVDVDDPNEFSHSFDLNDPPELDGSEKLEKLKPNVAPDVKIVKHKSGAKPKTLDDKKYCFSQEYTMLLAKTTMLRNFGARLEGLSAHYQEGGDGDVDVDITVSKKDEHGQAHIHLPNMNPDILFNLLAFYNNQLIEDCGDNLENMGISVTEENLLAGKYPQAQTTETTRKRRKSGPQRK
mmetsp:Transcript_121882/g.171513  ORF Transcript_121882/g.171513 Transcript_121882/m.171513 type:complete len:338 (+) Transcript_121882:288-1301(+)